MWTPEGRALVGEFGASDFLLGLLVHAADIQDADTTSLIQAAGRLPAPDL